MDVNERLRQLNLTLPEAPPPGGVYTPVREFGGKLAYVSGCGPRIGDDLCLGRLGDDMTLEQGRKAARNCALNILAVIKKNLGDLDRVKSVVKVLGFVRCTDDFGEQPKVMNGASELLIEVFGEDGRAARSAIGTNALPGGIAVEVEALIELR